MDSDEIVFIPEENVFLEFEHNNQQYAVISESEELEEDDDIYIVKVDELDDKRIIRNINSDDEYNEVLNIFFSNNGGTGGEII